MNAEETRKAEAEAPVETGFVALVLKLCFLLLGSVTASWLV